MPRTLPAAVATLTILFTVSVVIGIAVTVLTTTPAGHAIEGVDLD